MANRILVTGASGQLGAYLVRELLERGRDVVAWSGTRSDGIQGLSVRPVDLTNRDGVVEAFRDASPSTVIHAGAMAAVADCVHDPGRADAVNRGGTALLAGLAAISDARLVFVSTDLVFDGERGPYREGDPPAPLSVYGRSKLAAEHEVLAFPGHIVVRVSLLFGPSRNGRASFFDRLVASLRAKQEVRLFHDEWRAPISLATTATALAEIAGSTIAGILHVAGPESMSRLEMGQRLAAHIGVDPGVIQAASRASLSGEPRPRDTSLDSSRWRELFPGTPWPRFEAALDEMEVR